MPCVNGVPDCMGVPEMPATSFEERSSSATIEKAHLVRGVSPSTDHGRRQVRRVMWRDFARDWRLWSTAERAAAMVLLAALATTPAFILVASCVQAIP
jgi:hypothetical protein